MSEMKIKKIFIAAPSGKDNGGGESLHQLASVCNDMGYDTYMYYFNNPQANISCALKNYHLKRSASIEDMNSNLLICPEMYTFVLRKYKSIQKCIWFLSLDFYLRSLPIYRTKKVLQKWSIPKVFFPLVFFAVLTKPEVSFSNFSFRKDKVNYFLYNVEYARQYIEKNVINSPTIKYLCGPLNNIYFEQSENIHVKKEDIVLYNPKKSDNFTVKIIKHFNQNNENINFLPIQNMTQAEVKDILMRSKVYIDFGYFPGPERLPREAVMMKCNIITSNLGSAANNIDVPINPAYKFDLEDKNISKIVELISDMVCNYEKYVGEYDFYREKVRAQHQNFRRNVAEFLEIVEKTSDIRKES